MLRGRVGRLIGAGLVDSFGLSLGWTVFNLYAVESQGLGAVGTYNAALLVGVALSAPFAGWLSGRLGGRHLLQTTAVVEAALRVGTFLLLLMSAPLWATAPLVALMGTVAWTGYAGMRSEIAHVDPRAAALAWYVAAIAAIEAVGAAAAALLPLSPGESGTALLVAVLAIYGGVLLPTFLVAFGSRRVRTPGNRRSLRLPRHSRALAGSFGIMVLASGPTMIAVGIAVELHGRTAVVASALAFTAGSLLAPLGAGVLERHRVPVGVLWPALGALMVGFWVLAPMSVAGLVAAQLASGAALTAFEGTMDAHVVVGERRVTASLAWAAAARALGSAAAVAVAPTLFATAGVTTVTALLTAPLLAYALLVGLRALAARAHRSEVAARFAERRQAPRPDPAISPELALVDPELAAWARGRLGPPGSVWYLLVEAHDTEPAAPRRRGARASVPRPALDPS